MNAACARMISDVVAPDVVVNNAGQMFVGLTEAFTADEPARQLDINLVGIHRVNRAVLPAMRERGRELLIHVSSTAGRVRVPFLPGLPREQVGPRGLFARAPGRARLPGPWDVARRYATRGCGVARASCSVLASVDGPFMETKEHLGGYHLIQAESLEEAAAIAGRFPTLSRGGVMEVRRLIEAGPD